MITAYGWLAGSMAPNYDSDDGISFAEFLKSLGWIFPEYPDQYDADEIHLADGTKLDDDTWRELLIRWDEGERA